MEYVPSIRKIVFIDAALVMPRQVTAVQEVPEIGDVSVASVMILSKETWHLIRPGKRVHGDRKFAEPPTVACPVIDVSAVSEENDAKMAEVIRACTAEHAGVINMAGLVTGLCALGGVVVKEEGGRRKDE